MLCTDLGNLNRSFGTADKHAQQRYVPPGHMARELAVTPNWLLVATGDEVRVAKRSAPFKAGPGPNPRVEDYLSPDEVARLQEVASVGTVAAPSEGGLIAAGETAYAGGQGRVSAIDLRQRRVAWTAEVDGMAYGLAAAHGRLFVTTSQGMLYCFAAQPADEPRTIVEKPMREPYADEDRPTAQAGEEWLKDFDPAAAAGGHTVAVVKERVVQANGRLSIELIAKTGEPILSGVEILPLESGSAD